MDQNRCVSAPVSWMDEGASIRGDPKAGGSPDGRGVFSHAAI